jgi:cytidine deaminase
MTDWERLIEVAQEARERAHAPYSHYRVGAALLADDGRIFGGANVENRTYGLTICAERSALVSAVTAGSRRFRALVVITGSSPPAAPCGQCRDALAEFGFELPMLLVNDADERREQNLTELLPEPFELPERPR